MVGNGQWVVLPYSVATELPGLRLSPPVVKNKGDGWPWWLVDYIYCKLNSNILPISALYVMRYGQALDCLIREVIIAEPELGPIHVLKAGRSDSLSPFYYAIWMLPSWG